MPGILCDSDRRNRTRPTAPAAVAPSGSAGVRGYNLRCRTGRRTQAGCWHEGRTAAGACSSAYASGRPSRPLAGQARQGHPRPEGALPSPARPEGTLGSSRRFPPSLSGRRPGARAPGPATGTEARALLAACQRRRAAAAPVAPKSWLSGDGRPPFCCALTWGPTGPTKMNLKSVGDERKLSAWQ